MHRFFALRLDAQTARLDGDEARHALTVLRLEKGDHVRVVLDGSLFDAVIVDTSDGVLVSVGEEQPSPEPNTHITLYQGLPKGDKMDLLTQKCTEAGVWHIVPVQMPRCVVRLDGKDGEKKRERWQRIALEAAKQSGRTHIPEISAPISQKEMLLRLPAHGCALAPWEDARGVNVPAALARTEAADIAIVIGPEGGMSADEMEALKGAGALPVTLGPRIFRTETAGLAALIMALSSRNEYA